MFNIEYNRGWANLPTLQLLYSGRPYEKELYEKVKQLRYRETSAGLYLADNLEDVVGFFYQNDANPRGYGGASFDIKMVDGTEKRLVGPWSSRSGCFNTKDRSVAIVECAWSPSSAFKVDYVRKIAKDIQFFQIKRFGEISYIPFETQHRHYVLSKFSANDEVLDVIC